MRRRLLLAAAAVLAAAVIFLLFTLPPSPAKATGGVDPDLQTRTVAGAYHVHTTRSDGAGDPAFVAHAAARAGLRFVIFTDHGDGTRTLDPPSYREGVLCLDATEISTTAGHYVALDMAKAPYPLGGEPSAVIEDVARLGGIGFAAHPDSPKAELAWTDWNVPFDGVEWLNADSEWRNESRPRLARALFDYLLKPAASLAEMLDRPTAALARWDSAASGRRVIALAAHDAHGGMRPRVEGRPRMAVGGVPSYEASFRTFAVRVILPWPLSGRADADARLVFEAIRQGRAFTAIDAVAGPAYLDFHAEGSRASATMGSAIYDPAVMLSAKAAVPPGASVVLLRNGAEVTRQPGGEVRARASAAGAYRVEIRAPGAPGAPPIPWVVSNPIYVDLPPPVILTPDASAAVLDLRECSWHVEKEPSSAATLVASPPRVLLAFTLRTGAVASQFVALACDLPAALPKFDAVEFRGSATSPARVAVQLRFNRDARQRWLKSVYLDGTERAIRVSVEDLVPAERDLPRRPDPASATTLLFVVDLTNAAPGTAGKFSVSDVVLAARQ